MRTVLLMSAILLLLSGCNQGSQQQMNTQSAAQAQKCSPVPVRHFDWEQKAKSAAEQVNGVDEAVAVAIDDDLDVAIKVTNFNRLRMETIEKDVKQSLKKAFPGKKIHVTSDKKLMMDIRSMNVRPWSNKPEDACGQKKALQTIQQKMKDNT